MTKGKVLVLGSNATRIEVQGGGTDPTGNYLNETVVPAMAMIEAEYNLVLATPNGTKPHIDEASDSAVHFGGDQAAYSRAKAFWANDPPVNQVSTLRIAKAGGRERGRPTTRRKQRRQRTRKNGSSLNGGARKGITESYLY